MSTKSLNTIQATQKPGGERRIVQEKRGADLTKQFIQASTEKGDRWSVQLA